MFICPHCKKDGIGILDKFWCGSDSPATCKFCQNLSYVPVKYRFGSQSYLPFIISWSVTALVIYIVLITGNIYLIAAIPVICLTGRFVELASLPMKPISKEGSVTSRKFGNWFVLIILAIIITSLSLSNG